MNDFTIVQPDGPLYPRSTVSRARPIRGHGPPGPTPGQIGTFGNRWDDPLGSYRVLYASSRRLGAFVETLASFRPDLLALAGLEAIEGDDHP